MSIITKICKGDIKMSEQVTQKIEFDWFEESEQEIQNSKMDNYIEAHKAYVVYRDHNNSQKIEEVDVIRISYRYVTVCDKKGFSEKYYYYFSQRIFTSMSLPKSSLYYSKTLAEQYVSKMMLKPKITSIIKNNIDSFPVGLLETVYKNIQVYDDEIPCIHTP